MPNDRGRTHMTPLQTSLLEACRRLGLLNDDMFANLDRSLVPPETLLERVMSRRPEGTREVITRTVLGSYRMSFANEERDVALRLTVRQYEQENGQPTNYQHRAEVYLSSNSESPYLSYITHRTTGVGLDPVDCPANEPVEVTQDNGTVSIWPRYLVSLCRVCDNEEIEPGSVVIQSEGKRRLVAVLGDDSYYLYSPLLFWLTPDPSLEDWIKTSQDRINREQLKERILELKQNNLRDTQRNMIEYQNRFLAACQMVMAAQKEATDIVNDFLNELETLITEDPQVVAAWINTDGNVWTLVGPIQTVHGKDYGFFTLDLTRGKAFAYGREWGGRRHANISDNGSFCFGPTGTNEYGRLTQGGHYAQACAFFCYALARPNTHGWGEYDPHFEPSVTENSKGDLYGLLNDYRRALFYTQKPDEFIEKVFNNGLTQVVRRRKHVVKSATTLTARQLDYLYQRLRGTDPDRIRLRDEGDFSPTGLSDLVNHSVFDPIRPFIGSVTRLEVIAWLNTAPQRPRYQGRYVSFAQFLVNQYGIELNGFEDTLHTAEDDEDDYDGEDYDEED